MYSYTIAPLFLSLVWAYYKPDVIQDLPGLEPVHFNQFSGYLEASDTIRLHYWFTESQRNRVEDPLILWLNGGPGCSSLDGLLTELGPFRVKENGTGLTLNPYSWNRIANIIFLESPAGVGFSYATDGHVKTNDSLTAAHNYAALKKFFWKFPEFRDNDLYIMGESYGGVYVPTLTALILDGLSSYHLNIKGLAVGNGLLSYPLYVNTMAPYHYSHGLISEKTWKEFLSRCCPAGIDNCNLNQFLHPRPDIDGWCTNMTVNITVGVFMTGELNLYDINAACHHHENPFGHMPCIDDSAMSTYLNRPDVRKSLNIPESWKQEWVLCSGSGNYTKMAPNDDQIGNLRKAVEAPINVLIYNGDADLACNFLMGQKAAAAVNSPLIRDKEVWLVDNQTAGYVTRYANLQFRTVKGAGHMVPGMKPKQAFHMIQEFLSQAPASDIDIEPKGW